MACYDTIGDRHYANLLLAELLYKNDYEQTNRAELQAAVAYYDSVSDPFLAARAHYINGVGYYERDSVVPACEEYLKAVEIMEEHFTEKELVGQKAKFMALAYTHLCGLFSDQYLHEQAIYFGKQSLSYYYRYDAESWNVAWILNEIGSQYEMKKGLDSAMGYYQKGMAVLLDTNTIIFRDLKTHIAFNSYKQGANPLPSLSTLYDLLKQAESKREELSRRLIIGAIYFDEAQYDSAFLYLDKVYNGTSSIGSKKQAAEWLVEICDKTNRDLEAQQYAHYLVPFANFDEIQGHVKSQLTDLCVAHEQKRNEFFHQKASKEKIKKTGIVITLLLAILVICSILYHFFSKRKSRSLRDQKEMAEKQLMEERQAHRIQQAALGGRLKQKNKALKDIKTSKENVLSIIIPEHQTKGKYDDETICKHIIMICNDENNPIKSTVPVSAYADLALNDRQKSELKAAAVKHYGYLFEKLKIQYPELKEKDLFYCYLSLLGLNNTQIAVLLQNALNTIWDREQRLKRIFGKNDSVVVILNDFLIY